MVTFSSGEVDSFDNDATQDPDQDKLDGLTSVESEPDFGAGATQAAKTAMQRTIGDVDAMGNTLQASTFCYKCDANAKFHSKGSGAGSAYAQAIKWAKSHRCSEEKTARYLTIDEARAMADPDYDWSNAPRLGLSDGRTLREFVLGANADELATEPIGYDWYIV